MVKLALDSMWLIGADCIPPGAVFDCLGHVLHLLFLITEHIKAPNNCCRKEKKKKKKAPPAVMRGEQACQQRGVEMLALLTKKHLCCRVPQSLKVTLLLATVKETINYQGYSSRRVKKKEKNQ